VGVPDGTSGGGGMDGLVVLACACCLIMCLCCIFSISGFSMIDVANLDLLLLILMP
jgi:hypothetical protein